MPYQFPGNFPRAARIDNLGEGYPPDPASRTQGLPRAFAQGNRCIDMAVT